MELQINFLALIAAAASSMVIGFVWYNPKVFGNAWMSASGTTEEKMKGANMAMIFGLSFLYAFLISFIIQMLTIHQFGAYGMIGGNPDPALVKPSFAEFMADYGSAYRTFKHGALHGFMSGLFLALPMIATNALYERRSYKYSLIVGGYWTVTFMIMGGIICAWQ
jgi:hypothetical protein